MLEFLTPSKSFIQYSGSLPLASGLKDTWKSKPKNVEAEPENAIGGLTDEHMSSIRPKFNNQVSFIIIITQRLSLVSGLSYTRLLAKSPGIQIETANLKPCRRESHLLRRLSESLVSPYSQGLHYLRKNRFVFTPL
jgi:hypothetical protein